MNQQKPKRLSTLIVFVPCVFGALLCMAKASEAVDYIGAMRFSIEACSYLLMCVVICLVDQKLS